MSVIRNVAIAGASGDLGTPVLNALIESKKFNITVLTRHSSKAQFPATVRVIPVDYNSLPELTTALSGQDAIISTLTTAAMDVQHTLIDAAISAGVKRFIPSEFSSDVGNPNASTLPVYQSKIAVHKALQAQAAENPTFTYTLIRHGPFLDWGLAAGFFFDFRTETPPFYDGGDRPFSTTTLGTIAQAVIGVLTHSDETKNRPVYVHDLVTTQRQIYTIVQKLAPGRKWNPVDVSTAELEAKAREEWAKGNTDLRSIVGLLCRAVFAEGYGGEFKEVDNELLGLGLKTEAGLEEVVKAVLGDLL
ncbi:oxidoreductase CipA-like protein [Aspergillus nomiae NRRL 13137]|uniref:Oxidoreductase CipA-like protein n=1 Tax=Aspergillus nomiae NRRL (strain ATCC 15546 / NRRL 13137 / CBS 260.88 / M93) TaxID=1509407 RepID=A0A0L1ILY0_ASPN3|nr:oxidoreductase CipA-like protein [Aspergillus nomiae NRRL 13137]KNG80512.1 oxidoreductase CipA-like protein [Aspergillus nomiae NRRL 13137]